MPTGDRPPTESFLKWQTASQTMPVFPVGMIINGGTTTDLSEEIVAAYDAPFPDEEYKAGARQFPTLVPTSPDDPEAQANRDAWKVLEAFEKPLLTAFSDSDPITNGGYRVFQKLVPGAQGQPHTTIEGGGHFLQEDRGPELAKVVLDFIKATS
jgi:haloalkane dehalogenase